MGSTISNYNSEKRFNILIPTFLDIKTIFPNRK